MAVKRPLQSRQLIGIALAAALLVATIAWRLDGSPTPQIGGAVTSTLEIPIPVRPGAEQAESKSRPPAVKLAAAVIAGKLDLQHLPFRATLRQLSSSGTSGVLVLCFKDGCAAFRRQHSKIIYVAGANSYQRVVAVIKGEKG